MDKMQNFVVGDIVTAPSPATSGTSVTVDSGSYFPDPSTFGEYNIVIWDRLSGYTPSAANCEIVRVTAKTTDDDNAILTITRAQESTTAKEVTTGWRAYLSPTKKYFDDLKTYIDNLQITKATGVDIDTGTDDDKLVTPLAIAQSYLGDTGSGDSITLVAEPENNYEASGIKIKLKAEENHAFGDVCRIKSNGNATLSNASGINHSKAVVMCIDETVSSSAIGNYLLLGIARNDNWNWNVANFIYLSTSGTTGSTLTQTAPSGSYQIVQILGVATHANRIYFNPQLVQIERI